MAKKNFTELRKGITDDPVRARRLTAAESTVALEYDRYQASLAELRRARNLTQSQLAKSLRISQPEVSRIEHQSDVYLSTLRSYVAATGGELELVARPGWRGGRRRRGDHDRRRGGARRAAARRRLLRASALTLAVHRDR